MKYKITFYLSITFVYFIVDVFIRNNPWYESIITVISFLFIFILYDKFFNSKVDKNTKKFPSESFVTVTNTVKSVFVAVFIENNTLRKIILKKTVRSTCSE